MKTDTQFGSLSRSETYLHLPRRNHYIWMAYHPLFGDGKVWWYRQIKHSDSSFTLQPITDERLIRVLEYRVKKLKNISEKA